MLPIESECDLDGLDFLDASPEELDRPLKQINGKTYAATWVSYERAPVLIILCEDGEAYSSKPLPSLKPISSLPFSVRLPNEISPGKRLSAAGVKKFLKGYRPQGDLVFKALAKGVDAFVSFEGSTTDQVTSCEHVAAWLMATYFLDAFSAFGYLWPTGERGSGKTQFCNVVTSVAYLGRTVTAGSSFASLRDEADYGATTGFDDCENVKDMEPSKRELLLAGNTLGAQIAVKESIGEGQWKTRYVNCFAPRLFSSIGLPDDVLNSRTISVPLVASFDTEKTRRSPSRKADWPFDVAEMIDDLWLLSLTQMSRVKVCDEEASSFSSLQNRNHDIFRPQLAIAWWLMADFGLDAVQERLAKYSESYQILRSNEQGHNLIEVTLIALAGMLNQRRANSLVATTEEILAHVKTVEEQEDCDVTNGVDTQRLGRLLSRLGLEKNQSHGAKRSWSITRSALGKQAKARGISLPQSEHSEQPSLPPVAPCLPF